MWCCLKSNPRLQGNVEFLKQTEEKIKRMKKIVLLIVAITIIVCGCKKYEEGPCISFRSAKSRIIGDWLVTEFNVDHNDELQLFNDSCGCIMYIPDKSDYQQINFLDCKNYLSGEFEGSYSFNRNHTVLRVYFDYLNNVVFTRYGPFARTSEWEILRLTKDEFKVSTIIDKIEYVIFFKKIN